MPPQHWRVERLRRYVVSRCDGPFGSSLKTEHYTDEGVRVLRLQNIGADRFLDRDAAFISAEHYATLGDHDARPGDLIVAALGDETHAVGRACIVPPTIGSAMVKADCFRLRLDRGRMLNAFVAKFLSSRVA